MVEECRPNIQEGITNGSVISDASSSPSATLLKYPPNFTYPRNISYDFTLNSNQTKHTKVNTDGLGEYVK